MTSEEYNRFARISERQMVKIRERIKSDELNYMGLHNELEKKDVLLGYYRSYSRCIKIQFREVGKFASPERNTPSTRHKTYILTCEGLGGGYDERGMHGWGIHATLREYQTFDELWMDLRQKPAPKSVLCWHKWKLTTITPKPFPGCTCNDCPSAKDGSCEYAYDYWNTHGDCLAVK